MKKLLLLALTVTAAASLTACGSSGHKEIDNFMEILNPTTEGEVANYSVTAQYSTNNIRMINVEGNNLQYYGYNGTAYEPTSTLNRFFEFKVSEAGVITADYYSRYNDTTPTSTDLSLETVSTSSYDYVGKVFFNAFSTVEAEVAETVKDYEIKSKDFTFDKDSSTFYFVNPADDSEDQKATTVKDSDLTIKFEYNDEDELVKVTVVEGYFTYIYSNFGEVSITMPADFVETPAA